MNFLNTGIKRAAFSFGLTAVVLLIMRFVIGWDFIDLYWLMLGTVVIYVPVTIIFAAISTFSVKDETESSADVLDD
ncbi:MAG: putative membrane protein [Arenicella sp.]|jgi:uncharacterized membrane protein